MISIAVSTAATAVGGVFQPLYITATSTARGQALKQLNATGGKHLVLVRYSPQHRFDFGVVFNDADIDHSPVIWARQGDAASNEALAKHVAIERADPDPGDIRLWQNPKKLATRGIPGPGDTAAIDKGNVYSDTDVTVVGLAQGGGSVSGGGTFTITGAMNWNGGTFGAAKLVIPRGAQLNVGGSAPKN